MSNQTTPDALLFDRRLIERNLRKGYLTPTVLDKHLAGLPDVAESAEPVAAKLHDEPALDDEDEDEG
ncbi:MAG: hypothetical protein JNK72_13860 [Myxococcales bacterium]|nr:hypothetical protein [Myxococcales bacterium]